MPSNKTGFLLVISLLAHYFPVDSCESISLRPPRAVRKKATESRPCVGHEFLRELGHRVAVSQQYVAGSFDLLVALHAKKSAKSVFRFNRANPSTPIILAFTGTDIYRDVKTSPAARTAAEIATRLVLLQPNALEELSTNTAKKVVCHHSIGITAVKTAEAVEKQL